MKRYYLLPSVVTVFFCCLAGIAFTFFPAKDTTYVLSEKQCNALFGKTPTEFSEDPSPTLNLESNVFCRAAEVDDSGNLLLTLTDRQKEQWKTSQDIQDVLYKAENNPDISLSADYKKVTVSCYKETESKNLTDAAAVVAACKVFQLLGGISPDEINIELTLIDTATKKTTQVIQINLDETEFTYLKNSFSSMYAGEDSKYVLTERQCDGLFNKTPTEFEKEPFPFWKWERDTFCKSAEVDDSGNLVLTMTDLQKEQWKNAQDIQRRLYEANNNPDISISSNYTKISATCYKETASKTIGTAIDASYACRVIQFLDGIPLEQINVELVIADSFTGNIVYTFSADMERRFIGPYSKDDFSSMYD